ncbi:MAG: peptide chain release factor N(5)-glutamine methyltransferase [Oscillospiraceae bacterium]|nr:peptide chain release factor N(5)-glutamine methyltransferase [Oscillospiraceae bacterium]
MVIENRELFSLIKEHIGSDFEAKELYRFIEENNLYEKTEELCLKRKSGYPLQYLIGEWDFFGRTFKVGEGVLIPRADTETAIEVALSLPIEKKIITDLCSGSGCIAITMREEIGADVYAVEKSEDAIKYLKENIKLNNSEINLIEGDVLSEKTKNKVPLSDIIISNPPYLTKEDMEVLQKEVTFEPSMALLGGDDGLYFYREITSFYKDKIRENGFIIYEIGMGQEEDVKQILLSNGFCDVKYQKDLGNIIRVVYARKKQED